MSPGKLAAQAGHAYLGAYLTHPIPDYQTPTDPGTKICLAVDDANHILKLRANLAHMGIANYLVVDRGHIYPPHFDGMPIITALGIGPITKDELPKAIQKLKLV